MDGDGNTKPLKPTKRTADPVETMTQESGQSISVDIAENATKKMKLSGDGDPTKNTAIVQPATSSKKVHFPPEIFEKIFSYLDEPKDVLAVINASPNFSDILNREKSTMLFNEVFPLIFPMLDKNEVLSSRLVCKNWKDSVDDFLQTHPRERITEPYPTEASRENGQPPLYYPILQTNLVVKDFFGVILSSKANILGWTAEIGDYKGNPFLLRDVYLEDSGSTTYWSHVFRFLAKFGKHIWHLHLFTEDARDQPCYFFHFKMLRRVLQLSLNVRTLSLCGFPSTMDSTSDDEEEEEQRLTLHRYIKRHPLPELPHLHTILELVSGEFYRQPMLRALLSTYSKQLRKLVFPMSWVETLPSCIYLQHITELDIQLNDEELNWRNSVSSLDVPNLAKVKLNVWVQWEISDLLEPFQNNFPSLVYIQIAVRRKSLEVNDAAALPRFVLEGVKTLEVLNTFYIDYDQLLNHLPKLEYLLVCFDPTKQDVSLKDGIWEIRKWMYSNSMYKSNLWRKMPTLKEFIFAKLGSKGDEENDIVSSKRYYRDLYNEILRNNKDFVLQ